MRETESAPSEHRYCSFAIVGWNLKSEVCIPFLPSDIHFSIRTLKQIFISCIFGTCHRETVAADESDHTPCYRETWLSTFTYNFRTKVTFTNESHRIVKNIKARKQIEATLCQLYIMPMCTRNGCLRRRKTSIQWVCLVEDNQDERSRQDTF